MYIHVCMYSVPVGIVLQGLLLNRDHEPAGQGGGRLRGHGVSGSPVIASVAAHSQCPHFERQDCNPAAARTTVGTEHGDGRYRYYIDRLLVRGGVKGVPALNLRAVLTW